ncbi:hypothetical protein SAMN05428974_0532 [Sphingopyxis sp. YR583]|uniref:hypothetical protein n=1 Tax=Sphingopyxis sp. YR583 TaxID=1881047 RepID=UPI0008A7C622|nr:hypothetical protein [Sphingopyxis sp. YR583]SEH12664.1 hypothetical protein SAMN05428974_0532 [Sphingopyxis sp. YR583]
MLSESLRENTALAPLSAPDRGIDWLDFDELLYLPVPAGEKAPRRNFVVQYEEVFRLYGDAPLAALAVPADLPHDEVQSDGMRIFDPVLLPMPPLERARLEQLDVSSKLDVLQSWEGAVIDVDEKAGEFTARLHDLLDSKADLREVTFDLREVSANDRDLLRPGGIFQWMIGYRRFNHGRMERVSSITFRRLPAWYSEDLAAARSEGEALAAAFTAD